MTFIPRLAVFPAVATFCVVLAVCDSANAALVTAFAAPAPTPGPAPAAGTAGGVAGPSGPSGSGSAGAPFGSPPSGGAGPGAPSPVPPTAEIAAPAQPPPGEGAATANATEPATATRVIVTGDAVAGESDHDAIVGGWGIEVRPVATTLPVFSRRATTGCPLAPPAGGAPATSSAAYACPPIAVSMLSVRHWVNRNLAFTVGAALAFGGGSQDGRLLDTYFGLGPAAGLSLLLGNWRHLAVAASPALSLVWFRAAGSAATTYVADLRADLEGELHFGFIGVPALSLGIRSGVLLRLEKSAELAMWSGGVSGATTLRGLVSDLSLRYYF